MLAVQLKRRFPNSGLVLNQYCGMSTRTCPSLPHVYIVSHILASARIRHHERIIMARTFRPVFLLCALCLTVPVFAQETGKQPDAGYLNVYWKDRLHIESKDEAFKMEFGGWVMTDFGHVRLDRKLVRRLEQDSGGEVELRSGRLATKAQVLDRIELVFQYDFASGHPHYKDVYFALKEIPWLGTLRAGHMKEPFSLEELTSRSDITFMERGQPNAFVPGRNLGVMASDSLLDNRMTWAAGVFYQVKDLDVGYGKENPVNVTARWTGLPVFEQQGRNLVHLGLSYSHKLADTDGSISFSVSPESFLVEGSFAETRDIRADGVDLVGPEIALVRGPFSAQAEYVHAWVGANVGTDHNFHGFYILGSYILTGEHRGYERERGAFTSVQPFHDFDPSRGWWGAIELALRYSRLDLEDAVQDGGRLNSYSAGLNWYLNKHLKLMVNYIRSDLGSGVDSDIVQSRLQLEF